MSKSKKKSKKDINKINSDNVLSSDSSLTLPEEPIKKEDTFFQFFIRTLVICSLVIIIKHLLPVEMIIINGDSMYPTYKDGEICFMDKLRGSVDSTLEKVELLDVVVARAEGMNVIKRVVGLPGDMVTIKTDGTVLVNGEELIELDTYQNNSTDNLLNDSNVSQTVEVPVNCFFLLGDNFTDSYDSRSFGPVNVLKIKGEVKEKEN